MGPEEIERVVGAITEKDVMDFAQRKLWDQDVAVSAIGSIEGLLDYNRYVHHTQDFLLTSLRGILKFCFIFSRANLLCNRIRNDMSRNA
jgi:hypothetical protein